MCADAFDDDTDDFSYVGLTERPPGQRRKHCLPVNPEQNERHEVRIFVVADGPLSLTKHQMVSDEALE